MSESAAAAGQTGRTNTNSSLPEWIAAIADQIGAGESVDQDALAAEHPDAAEMLRRLLPAIDAMALLRSMAVPNTSSNSERPGTETGSIGSLGDFGTLRVIGRGGMGVVYEAVQISLNRPVALKILPMTSAGDPRKLKRFQIEAQAAALLHDPHIVPVYMVGSENGVHFFVMQLIEGRTLAEVIAEFRVACESSKKAGHAALTAARPSARFVAELGRQAALALHYAHEQGIVHRDVKPSNLLVEGSGWLWVADFGLARILIEGDQTSTDVPMGTPRYMSPEQAIGSRGVVDHRTDVYSLGTTLYELITLQPAFDTDDRLEMIVKIAHDEPRPPRQIDPSIPRDLETIVLKAMSKDPSSRYATAGELADDLGYFLEGRPIIARRPSAVDRVTKWSWRHRPAVVAAAGFVLCAAIGLGGFALWRDGMFRRHNRELKSALVAAERNESSARRLLYSSHVRLAQQAETAGQVDFAQELLEGLRPEPAGRDLRGFEWHYLRRICDRGASVLSQHERLTTARALSPDGRTLVTGHLDGLVVLWDLCEGRKPRRFQAHPRRISGLSFSPDGRVLASWSTVQGMRSEVTLWNPDAARELAAIPRIAGHVINAAFVNRGRALVILEHDLKNDASKNKLVSWDLARGPRSLSPARRRFSAQRWPILRAGAGWRPELPLVT